MSSSSSEIGAVGGAVGGAIVDSAVGSGDLRRRPPQSLWPPRSAMMCLFFPAAAGCPHWRLSRHTRCLWARGCRERQGSVQ